MAPHRPHTRRRRRRGAVVIEMILVLVVILIATIGIVQFGEFLAKGQQVALAARVGALEASQTADLADDCRDVPDNVISAIEHHLASSDIAWCAIRLEHNVDSGRQVALQFSNGSDCLCETDANLDCPPPRGYVRVTVCVPLSEVLPEQLSFFGQQLYGADRTYEHTAVFRFELDK